MANQQAKQDDNQFPALLLHTGTAGTAETIRAIADSDGNLMVNLAAGETINIGTLNLGTISLVKAGTITKLEGGSVAITSGTVTETTALNAQSDNSIGISGAKYSLQSHFEGTTGWVSGTTVANFGVSTQHRGAGTNSLEFDKIAGDTSVMISKTIDAFDMSEYSTHAIGVMSFYVSDLTNVDYVFARIGTDASNYCQWNFDAGILTAGWNQVDENIGAPTSQTGNGYDLSAITWIAFGVVFDASANTLTDIRTGGWGIKRVLNVADIVAGDVQVNSPNLIIRDRNSNTRLDVAAGATYNYLYSRNTDGANLTPAGDGTARPIYTQVAGGSAVVTNGTIASSGTVTGVGVVGNVASGTIAQVTSVSNVAGGSIVMTAGTVSTLNTVGTIGVINDGTVKISGTVPVTGDFAVSTINLIEAGTITRLEGGSIVVTAGTVTTSMGDLSGGTINLLENGTVSISGTVPVTGDFAVSTINLVEAGTITSVEGGSIAVTALPDLPGGTVDMLSAGTVSMINAGTITSVGTIPGIGILGNVNSGTIGVVSSVTNLASGTLAAVTSVTNVAAGSIKITAGTIGAGTINVMKVGTITAGTINAGTITAGTIDLLKTGTIAEVTSVSNLAGGTVGVVSSVTNLAGGTLGILTNGTVATNILPLGGVVLTTAVTLGTAAGGSALPASALSGRKSMICYNVGTLTCYIGGTGVSTTAGIPIGTAEYSPAIDLGTTILYGISSATAGATLVVMEVS